MKYFAYGSNMLTERLNTPERCPKATLIGVAFATGYKVRFIKKSKDKSGKATLKKTYNESDIVYGVLFEIDKDEVERLDKAEGVSDGGYEVITDFTVIYDDQPTKDVRTYIALAEKCEEVLEVYEWYLSLVIAGARQHGLESKYIQEMIETNKVVEDMRTDGNAKIEAFKILNRAGFDKIVSELKR